MTAFSESATTATTYARTNEPAKITAEGRDWHVAYAGTGGLSSIWSDLSIHTRSFDIHGRLEAVRLGSISRPRRSGSAATTTYA
ncbi:MAG: hypothetical protein LLG24_05835 [Actinomycetia bacterium]|nr:hypothetical protein [Actinomycetes bacterium]